MYILQSFYVHCISHELISQSTIFVVNKYHRFIVMARVFLAQGVLGLPKKLARAGLGTWDNLLTQVTSKRIFSELRKSLFEHPCMHTGY